MNNYYIIYKKYIRKIQSIINNYNINDLKKVNKYFEKMNKIRLLIEEFDNKKENVIIEELNNYQDLINVAELEIDNLPHGVNISTMCASCKLNTKLNIEYIENYLKITPNDILEKKISNDKIETLLPIKKKKKRHNNLTDDKENKENKNYFYNQITIVIRVTSGSYVHLEKEPRINMKLFKNGSIQMSGCKSVTNINIALNKIINKMKESVFTDHPFLESMETLNVSNFKMDMINSNYKINMEIYRTKLHNLLTKKKIRSTYEQCIKACVIIKLPNPNLNQNINNKDISIFIFQKGNIIINSAKSREQLINAYNYINNILFNHKDDIIKKDNRLEKDIIFKFYNEIMADVNCGLITLDQIDIAKGLETFNLKKKNHKYFL